MVRRPKIQHSAGILSDSKRRLILGRWRCAGVGEIPATEVGMSPLGHSLQVECVPTIARCPLFPESDAKSEPWHLSRRVTAAVAVLARCRSIRRRPRSAPRVRRVQPGIGPQASPPCPHVRRGRPTSADGRQAQLAQQELDAGSVDGVVARHAATSRLETGSTTWTAASSS
jgi:hypothetical protein